MILCCHRQLAKVDFFCAFTTTIVTITTSNNSHFVYSVYCSQIGGWIVAVSHPQSHYMHNTRIFMRLSILANGIEQNHSPKWVEPGTIAIICALLYRNRVYLCINVLLMICVGLNICWCVFVSFPFASWNHNALWSSSSTSLRFILFLTFFTPSVRHTENAHSQPGRVVAPNMICAAANFLFIIVFCFYSIRCAWSWFS